MVEEVSVINIHTDTLFNTAPKKNFFKRLGEVFKPSKDSLQVITTQRYDTVTIAKVDSLPIISEVEIIVNKATETYETNMTRIGREAANIIVSDRALSEQISILLM